jgi:hypothetical protein
MQKRKVYLSVPLSVNMSVLEAFASKITSFGHSVKYWDRVFFHPSYFREADTVVFLLPENAFSYRIENLPVGVKREVLAAKADKKQICVGYITSNNVPHIYTANVDQNWISGVGGSSHVLKGPAVPKEIKYESENTSNTEFDERLLLMM